ncbi:MAG: HepT-like ribonuclease domain-containing protein, partial [Terriglobales bacterium]
MLGMRIVVAHYYWSINDDIIWDTVQKDFPGLKRQIKAWRIEREREVET